MIVVQGNFKDSLSYFRFLNTFRDSKLSALQDKNKTPVVNYLDIRIKTQLFFCDVADEVLNLSLKNGVLSPWRDEIKIKDSMTNILEKYSN